ncbi:Cu(I)-responsive transcriptional regulator [Vibrio gangliei]|uniref:Cu(I)-responsive transcriptional regulator n=1 Tax=Vibrio gangliei TaxID=2077090 RepID=UPI000D020708|nr:Cu(I)-responsive transcriptional regulator [Vibrio gangliei]
MNISQVSKLTGLTAKSIRFYEDKGIIQAPLRLDNGYRDYSEAQIEQLKMVARARAVGFHLDECKALVDLASDPCRTSFTVKETTKAKLAEVDKKLAELTSIRQQLVDWINECPGDEGPDCPIINGLSGTDPKKESRCCK